MNVLPGAEAGRQRLLLLARALYEGEDVTARWIMFKYGVAWTTAKRDMMLLRMYLPVQRSRPPKGAETREHRLSIRKRAR